MEPYLFSGDHVLTFNWSDYRKGNVVVFRHGQEYWIKRIHEVIRDKISVSGDNKKMSSKIEPISKSLVIGRVILKY